MRLYRVRIRLDQPNQSAKNLMHTTYYVVARSIRWATRKAYKKFNKYCTANGIPDRDDFHTVITSIKLLRSGLVTK